MNEKVPERYFVVKNNDHVQIKYLLVYAEGSAETKYERDRDKCCWHAACEWASQ